MFFSGRTHCFGPTPRSTFTAPLCHLAIALLCEHVSFDGVGHVQIREQIVYCLILTGEREP
jgi:hypothetical protein